MRAMETSSSGFVYSDTGGDGPVVVFLHGVLMNGTLWDDVVDRLRGRYRCIVPELPFGAHRTPMPADADLTLQSIAKMIAGFVAELDLHDVTLVCNDWGGAQLVISPGGSDRVANLVLVSCEAFDNYPPGLPGRLLCLNASLPGGTFMTSQLLRPRLLRHLPITFGGLSTSPKLSSATSNASSHAPQQPNGDRVDATSFEIMRRERITETLAFDGDFSAAGFIEVRP